MHKNQNSDFLRNHQYYTKKLTMSEFKHSFRSKQSSQDRRSGINRRWIKTSYSGEERRKTVDRRLGLPTPKLPVPEDEKSRKLVGIEKILYTSAVQLEAVTRLLLEKGIIREQELLEMMQKVQSEYSDKAES